MINIDDRILQKVNESEMWVIMHVAKRMRSNRMTAWPSLETIAKDCRWSLNTTRRWRDSLVKKGYLTVEERQGTTNIYKFSLDGIGIFTPMDGEYTEEEPLPKVGTTPLPKVGTTPLPKVGTTPLPKVGTTPLPKVGTQKDINNGDGLTNQETLTKESSTAAVAPDAGPTVLVIETVAVEDGKNGTASRGGGPQTKSWTRIAAEVFDEVAAEKSQQNHIDYQPFNWDVCQEENFRQLKNLRDKAIVPDFKKKFNAEPTDEQMTNSFRAVFRLAWDYFYKIQKDTGGALHYTPTSVYKSYNNIKTTAQNGNINGTTTINGTGAHRFGQGVDHNGTFDSKRGY